MRVRHNSLPQHTTSPEQRGFCAKDPSTPSLIPRLSLSPTNDTAKQRERENRRCPIRRHVRTRERDPSTHVKLCAIFPSEVVENFFPRETLGRDGKRDDVVGAGEQPERRHTSRTAVSRTKDKRGDV